jgi:two-component system, chemotaxis family, CheB/CheR fusion protein
MKQTVSQSFYIIGIGASAGGLEALEQFFQAMPPENGMAFVVIQHLSPDYKSMMAEILSKYTSMPVCEAADNMEVKPNHVYLIPPKKSMTIMERRLRLTEKSRQSGLTLPIDIFFHSLAKDSNEKAIAIVLSGTGSDGTRGIRGIKEADGMVLVQSRDSAKFDGMPQSAINTGLADFILPPKDMPDALLKFVLHPAIATHPLAQEEYPPINEANPIAHILGLIKDYANVDFNQYKPATVLRRIERRAGIRQCRDVSEYLVLLRESESERKTLFKELLIGVTKFFRNPEAFESLQQTVIPQLFAGKQPEDIIRVWVAACSTGEEAYSLAILLAEHRDKINALNEIKIFATDIDNEALAFAANAEYPESTVADVLPERLIHFFSKRSSNHYTISTKIRKMVVFAQHDLTHNPPFNKLDLISCRNLFIYLQAPVQERILHLFHFALRQQGYLFLGESESISENTSIFSCLDKHNKIFRARPGMTPPRWREATMMPQLSQTQVLPIAVGKGMSRQVGDYLQKLLLDKFLPPCVLINDNLDVLYISERAGAYLHIRGIPDYNLLRMVPDSIAAYARTAVNNALKHGKTVVYKATRGRNHDQNHYINLHVEPLPQKHSGAPLLLMTFEENAQPLPEELALDFSDDARRHLEEMEKELAYTRETLQATIEELETSNEELQSTNEELLAANEELQSTNEELQAVNEELVTVNTEHQHKIHELEELNETVDNLLRSSRVGTVFLDRHLRIRRFTPAIREEMHLLDSDIGRPFEDIRHRLKYPDLQRDLMRVMTESQSLDVEIQGEGGHWYLAQMSPYLSRINQVEGCVLNLVNITPRKQAEQRMQNAQERLHLAVETGSIGIWEWDLSNGALVWDEMMFQLYGVEKDIQTSAYDIWRKSVHPDDITHAESALLQVTSGEHSHFDQRFRIIRPDNGKIRHIRAHARLRRDNHGRPLSLLGVNWDETTELETHRALEQTQQLLNASQHLARIGGWEAELPEMRLRWTEEFYRIHDFDPNTPPDLARSLACYAPEDRAQLEAALAQTIDKSIPYDMECQFTSAKGRKLCVRAMGEAVFVDGKAVKLRGLLQDISAQKQVQHHLQTLNRDFTVLLDNTTDFIYFKDEHCRIRFCSQSLADMTGHDSWRDMIGKHDREIFSSKIAQSYMEEEQVIFDEGKPLLNKIEPYDDINGHQGWINVSKWPVFDNQGKVVGIFGISRDITGIKTVQTALEHAKEAAEAASYAKSAFLANMSHELRTPLNAIMGYAQILMKNPELNEDTREKAAIIERSGEHLLTLINDVLDLSKIEAGRLELITTEVHLQSFFDELVHMNSVHIRQKGLHFNYERHAPSDENLKDCLPLVVIADEKRLRQIFLNLLSNAVKFTDSGHVTLRVIYQKNALCVEVEDSGRGIAQEDMTLIFEAFRQIGTHPRYTEGTGLGLSITHRLVNLMGGMIEVISTLGKGSLFRVRLPLEVRQWGNLLEKNLQRYMSSRKITGYLGERRRILVVDDVSANRQLLHEFLGNLGFIMAQATNGTHALEQVERFDPHLIFMDLRMPGMDGFECVRRIRMDLCRKNIIIAAFSASVFHEQKQHAIDSGCDVFLEKPLNTEKLFNILEKYCAIEWIATPLLTATISPDLPLNTVSINPELRKKLLYLSHRGEIQGIKDCLLDINDTDSQEFKEIALELCKNFKIRELCVFFENTPTI